MVPRNGASKFQLVATNDTTCDANANWDVIYEVFTGNISMPFGFETDLVSREGMRGYKRK